MLFAIEKNAALGKCDDKAEPSSVDWSAMLGGEAIRIEIAELVRFISLTSNSYSESIQLDNAREPVHIYGRIECAYTT